MPNGEKEIQGDQFDRTELHDRRQRASFLSLRSLSQTDARKPNHREREGKLKAKSEGSAEENREPRGHHETSS